MSISILDLFNLDLIDLYPLSNPLVNEELTIIKLYDDINKSDDEIDEIIKEKLKRIEAKEDINFWAIVPGIVFAAAFTIARYIKVV